MSVSRGQTCINWVGFSKFYSGCLGCICLSNYILSISCDLFLITVKMPYRNNSRFSRGHRSRGAYGRRFGRRSSRNGRFRRNNGRFRKGRSYIQGSKAIIYMNPSKNPVPMPQAYFCKHQFGNTFDTLQGRTEFFNVVYTPSNLFDIFSGRDAGWAAKMAEMYETYCVYGYKWTLKAANIDSTGSLIGIVPWPDVAVPATFTDASVRTGGTYKQLGKTTEHRSVLSQSGYVSVPKLVGLPLKQFLNEPEFWGTSVTVPTRNPPLYVWYQNQEKVASTNNFTCMTMTLYVKWFDRKALADPNPPAELLASLPLSLVPEEVGDVGEDVVPVGLDTLPEGPPSGVNMDVS